ncbi:MAG: Flp pilus assembly protein TadG [Janthinobacterium sp.]|jgi:Flp pilus assembly protein TadG
MHRRRREGGVVAVIFSLSLVALIGFAGLILDLGRLYVNKTELQNASDACALAAANELVCDAGASAGICPQEFLNNATAAGLFAASRNKVNFQSDPVDFAVIGSEDITFHTAIGPASSYLSSADGANTTSRFAMCTARMTGIIPWFMGALGIGAQSVAARAVATLAPGQTSCNAAPVGICSRALPAPDFGRVSGDWITSAYSTSADSANLTGDFRWIDFTSGGGASPIRAQLLGSGTVCGIRGGDTLKRVTGSPYGALSAWNTRFGIYGAGAAGENYSSAAPDKTGYAYPSSALPSITRNAYAHYRSAQSSNMPFTSDAYGVTGFGSATSSSNHLQHGAERRLIAVPVFDCDAPPAHPPILAMACVLMLNPMSNDPSSTNAAILEWRGLANDPGSPCRSVGIAGNHAGVALSSGGPLVATLVR